MQDQIEWLEIQIKEHEKLFQQDKDVYWKEEIEKLQLELSKRRSAAALNIPVAPPEPPALMEVVSDPLPPEVAEPEVEEVMEEEPVVPVYDLNKNIVADCISRLNATANIYQALDHYQKGNFRRAISAAEKCIRNKVEVNLAHYIMALSYYGRNNSEAAMECLKKIPQNAHPSEVINDDLPFHDNEKPLSVKASELRGMISAITLSSDGSSDIQRALKHFRKKNFIKAMSLAKASIREGVEKNFAHLLIAMSLYHCEDKNFEDVRQHLTLANQNLNTGNNSHMQNFAREWAGPLQAALNIQIEDVIECIAIGLKGNNLFMRHALEGLVKFEALDPNFQFNSKLDRYTQYKIMQRLHADKKISSQSYVQSLKNLAIKESDNSSLYEKVERQITRHSTNIVSRAGSYGAHLARNFFKAARDKYYINAFVKFADEMRKQKINGIGDFAFHVVPHLVPLIIDLLVYAAYSVASAVRWLVSPFIGYSSAKRSEVKPAPRAADAPLPVVNKPAETKAFKFHHVKHGAGLGFFAKAIEQHRVVPVVSSRPESKL